MATSCQNYSCYTWRLFCFSQFSFGSGFLVQSCQHTYDDGLQRIHSLGSTNGNCFFSKKRMENLGYLYTSYFIFFSFYLSRSNLQSHKKLMNNRHYNIYFHTHTVSGIVISVVLFVIFFAGSFSFFRDEIINWERNESTAITREIQLDYNTTLNKLDKE